MTVRKRKPRGLETEDLISQFESGEGVSEKSKRTLKTLTDRQEEKVSSVHTDPIFNSGAASDLVLLSHMMPQSDNSRYLPVKLSVDEKASSIEKLTDCVVCEKGLFENRLDKNHPRYDDVENEIEEILDLANQLRHNDLIHAITVWRASMSSYPIISGHRRYYALRYLYGGRIKVKSKIYAKKPAHVNVLRHVENASRQNLKPSDTIRSFKLAMIDLEPLLNKASTKGERTKIACEHLGKKSSIFYRYDTISNTGELGLEILDRKIFTSLRNFEKQIQGANKAGGVETVEGYLQYVIDNNSGVEFDEYREKVKTKEEVSDKPKKKGRGKTYYTLPKVKVGSGSAILRLLKEDVTALDCGVDWESLDVNNAEEMENAVRSVIETLVKEK